MAVYEVLEDGTIVHKAGKNVGNLGCLRTEVVYDMTSNDASKNLGYVSGIGTGKVISGKDFSKYDKLIIHATFENTTSGTGILDLSHKISGTGTYRTKLIFGPASTNHVYYYCFVRVDGNKTEFANGEMGYSSASETGQLSSTSTFISKIEGVLKTPAMIYTGAELHEGNGISIENGVISSEHPIGSYHICKTGSENPASLFGGSWIQIRTNVALPMGGTAKVITSASDNLIKSTNPLHFRKSDGSDTNASPSGGSYLGLNYNNMYVQQANSGNNKGSVYPVNLIADFTTASSVLYVDIWEREA